MIVSDERIASLRMELGAAGDAPCPRSRHGSHADPDNSGACIYCSLPIGDISYMAIAELEAALRDWREKRRASRRGPSSG